MANLERAEFLAEITGRPFMKAAASMQCKQIQCHKAVIDSSISHYGSWATLLMCRSATTSNRIRQQSWPVASDGRYAHQCIEYGAILTDASSNDSSCLFYLPALTNCCCSTDWPACVLNKGASSPQKHCLLLAVLVGGLIHMHALEPACSSVPSLNAQNQHMQ